MVTRDDAADSRSISGVPLLDVTRGNQKHLENIRLAVDEICQTGRFIGGPACQQFEDEMARLCQTEHAIGCASGSEALLISLMALDVGPGDEVLVPSFTFFATASCVWRLGAIPVWVDIDPETFNVDPEDLRARITDRTKAIIPVHLFGQCAEMDPILAIASDHHLAVIEDAAQAIGATYRGIPAGAIGDVGCFSFYPTKNLGAFGDAGVVTTRRQPLADRLRLIANHGMKPRYHHSVVGINSRLDAIQAAVLTVKMKSLEDWSQERRENAERYERLIGHAGLGERVVLPRHTAPGCHVWNQYTIRVTGGHRDAVRQRLSEANVGTEVYYPVPLHRQECFANSRQVTPPLPQTDRAAEEVLSLPIFPELTDAEQDYVVDRLVEAVHAVDRNRRKAS